MAVPDKISKLIKNQFPDFYKEEGENFLAFMEGYYEYMEQEGKLTHEIRNLESYRDISTTTDDYIQYFFNTLLPSVPIDVVADKKLMAKYIGEFNRSRGTLASYNLLFRTVYNEDVELNYPADQILKVSDGDWRIDRYLVTSYDAKLYTFIGKTIKGVESAAEALVEDVVRRVIRGRDLMQIILSNAKGTFNNLEPIRLLSDTNADGLTPIIEAGINQVQITSPGGEYRVGDIVKLISDDIGEFAKVVVTDTSDLGGTLTFSIQNGGSGYTASTDTDGTEISLTGGDGSSPASFIIGTSDINDTYSIQININTIASNNIYGALGASINGSQMSTFANTIIGATDYGFPESAAGVTAGINYHDHKDAWISIANTVDTGITSGSIATANAIFGATSGANGQITSVIRSYANNLVVCRIDGYRDWQTGEKVNISTSTGTTVGTVSKFAANTVGWHPVQIAVISGQELLEGEEIRGRTSGAIGVVRHVGAANTGAYTAPSSTVRDVITYRVGANTSANLTSQFTTGPMKPFLANESVVRVSANTTVGNVVYTTSNASVESIYTKLEDAFIFDVGVFGTIAKLSNVIGGAGYSKAPTVNVTENNIASLGIGEQIITMVSANNELFDIDTTDRITQTPASGDIKLVLERNTLANSSYEVVAKVWQPINQRDPGNIKFANNTVATLERIVGDYTPGYEPDNRAVSNTMSVTITSIDDRGVLGKNAIINAGVGANGTITGIRTLDSGFSYKHNENVRLEATTRPLATGATGTLSLKGVANSEGYYATSRSQVSTSRGYIQDGEYYQEFSYEIVSPISLARYRDFALKLCHPAGQALFGKYRSQSNAYVTVTANTALTKQAQSNGTISINDGSFTITGVGTNFDAEFANNGTIIIEHSHKNFYKLPLNIVSSATSANVKIAWANTNLSGANAYYITGSF